MKLTLYTVNKNTNLDWLEQCLVAINAQTYKNFNYLFLDYGSDNFQKVHKLVTSKLNNINYELRSIDPIVGFNFIDAIKYCMTKLEYDYIMRVDADDILANQGLEKLVENLYNEDLVHGNYYFINDDNQMIEGNSHDKIMPAHSLISKNIIKNIKWLQGQEFRDGVNLQEAINKGNYNIKKIEDHVFYYRKHSNSLTSDKEKINYTDNVIKKNLNKK